MAKGCADSEAMECYYCCPMCGAKHLTPDFVKVGDSSAAAALRTHKTGEKGTAVVYSCCGRAYFCDPDRLVSTEEIMIAQQLELYGQLVQRKPDFVLCMFDLTMIAAIDRANAAQRRALQKAFPVQCRMYDEWANEREAFLRRYGFGSFIGDFAGIRVRGVDE